MKNRIVSCTTLALCLLVVAACQGRPAPLSVQAGSSIVIPYGAGGVLPPGLLVGYGGATYDDGQRGSLLFRLDGPGGFELVTRGATRVLPPLSSEAGSEEQLFLKQQVVVLLDVPANAPVGQHSLYVSTVRMEGGTPVEHTAPAYHGEIEILPPSIPVDVGGGQVVDIEGEATPLEAHLCLLNCSWIDVSQDVSAVTPRPELVIKLDESAHAAEIRVEYPESVIDLVDVFESIGGDPLNHRAIAWLEDEGLGEATLRVASSAPGREFTRLSLVFELDDAAAAFLDPTTVNVTVERATDSEGAPVAATAAVEGVF